MQSAKCSWWECQGWLMLGWGSPWSDPGGDITQTQGPAPCCPHWPLPLSRCPQCPQGRCPLSLSRCPRCWRRAAPGDTGRPTVCSRSYWLDTGQGDWVTTTSPDTANFSWLLHRVAVMSVIHRFIVFQDSTPPLYYLWCCIIDFKLNVSRQLPFDQRIWLLLLLKWHLEKFLQELGNCKRALSFQMIDFYWPDKI